MKPITQSELGSILSEVDLFICSSSFEDRCFILPQVTSKVYSGYRALVCYNSNEYKTIIDNAKTLDEILSNSVSVELSSNAPVQNALSINRQLDDLLSKPIENIFLDITTFTHETLLVIIRLLKFRQKNFKALFVGYVGAKEYSLNVPDELKWLSTGISDIRSVIGYPGVNSPARENHLIVLFGFEDDRTKELIELMQFDSISLGFGPEDDSILSNHFKINYERHTKLMNYYSDAHKFTFSLTDPFEAANSLRKEIERFRNKNIVIAAMNTKLSTLGAALVGIENPKIQLIYAKAIQYNVEGYSEPKDDFYCYKLWESQSTS